MVSLEQAADLARELGASLPADRFDLVVGIANGGVHPAFYVAETIGLPLERKGTDCNSERTTFGAAPPASVASS